MIEETMMKGLSYVIAGSLAVGAVGCSSEEYRGAGEYSCERDGDTITARNGETYTYVRSRLGPDHDATLLVYSKDLSIEKAVKAVRACSEAFGKKIE